MNCVIKSWIIRTVAADITDVAVSRGAWLAIEEQFLGHRESHAIYCNTKFRHFCLGHLSVADYFHQYKKLAKQLGDLGEVITDRTLVMNLLRGLNEKYSVIRSHLSAPGRSPPIRRSVKIFSWRN